MKAKERVKKTTTKTKSKLKKLKITNNRCLSKKINNLSMMRIKLKTLNTSIKLFQTTNKKRLNKSMMKVRSKKTTVNTKNRKVLKTKECLST